MPLRDTRRPLAALMATCLALAIVASGLTACSGAPEERPAPPATATPAAAQPTGTPSPTPVATAAPTGTPSPTPVATVAPTGTPSPTAAPTPTATPTPTAEATPVETPSSTTIRYDRLDATGAVATAGSYAFLMPDGEATSVVTTYEQLRTEATVMRVNVADAHGASWAGFYDTVAVGDVVAWYEADDCWTRYRTTSTPEAVAGSSMREFGVEWFAYAGTGCAGAISTAATVSTQWDPPVIATRATGSRAVTLIPSPVRYGPYLLIPSGWKGEIEPFEELWPVSPVSGSSADPLPEWPSSVLDEVRRHPLWREPVVPAGWSITGQEAHNSISLSAAYENDEHAVAIHISWSPSGPRRESVPTDVPGVNTSEARTIDGHPAVLWYDPTGALDIPVNTVSMYDEATGIEYIVSGYTFVDIDTMIAIARSFLSEATPTPTPTATAEPAPAETPPPPAFRYDTFDTTGAVATAGSYAFLEDPADTTTAVTTYEALRDGTTTALLIHKSDAHGASQAALYDAVEAGDLFEWREADDCFVRYKVTEVKPDPSGTVPRKLLAVEWLTYAYTGCSGGIPGDTAVTVRHDPPPVTSYSVTSPIRHGPFLLIPKGWTGATEEPTRVTYPQSATRATWNRPAGWTGSLAEIQQHPLWSAPELPSGWAFDRANDFDGYLATEYVPADRTGFIEVHVWRVEGLPIHEPYVDPTPYAGWMHEARLIDDYPAFLIYDPSNRSGLPVTVLIFKSDSGIIYEVKSNHWALNTDYQSVIEIARSLFEPPNPLPPPTTFRYDRYDTTGEVAEPGSYAFLADPADTTSAVSTYEALRDGTTTALLIHKSDAHGASQAALYDAVAAGDLFEWREADDCFVRYKVTEVKPDPAGAVPRKLLAVEWMTYAFTGCSGAVATDRTAVSIKAGPLPNLGGTGITAPVVHGVYQIVPVGWTGATKASVRSERSTSYPPERLTGDINVARQMRYWRDPTVPEGWVFSFADEGGNDVEAADGYCATWVTPTGDRGFKVCARKGSRIWFSVGEGSWHGGNSVFETRVVAGRPAAAVYSKTDPIFPLQMLVYDAATDVEYKIIGFDISLLGANVDAVIAIARGLFESANAP